MSNVRLSNGSPTLERTDARLSDHPKPSACRNLFGPVDHEALRENLKGHLQEIEEASTAKWNFDFAKHMPLLNGKFEWELVDCNDLPNFYSREKRSEKGVCPSGTGSVDLNGNHNCLVSARQPCGGPERCDGQTERSDGQAGCKEQCAAGQRKRPASHDPSSQTKRSHTSTDEVSLCPGITHSVEHTPRKNNPKKQT